VVVVVVVVVVAVVVQRVRHKVLCSQHIATELQLPSCTLSIFINIGSRGEVQSVSRTQTCVHDIHQGGSSLFRFGGRDCVLGCQGRPFGVRHPPDCRAQLVQRLW
jgi:hypothetical protein